MKVRINNIECRLSQGRYEILQWYKNSYYGSEKKLIEDGYERINHDSGGFSFRNGNHSIDGSCFKNPESCCTIAYLTFDRGENCCDLTTVGTRLLELGKTDKKTFFKVYKIAEKEIRKIQNKK